MHRVPRMWAARLPAPTALADGRSRGWGVWGGGGRGQGFVGRRGARPCGIEAGIHKIRHVIVVMQENRSFDSYFGTYPGADGIPCATVIPPCASPILSWAMRSPVP